MKKYFTFGFLTISIAFSLAAGEDVATYTMPETFRIDTRNLPIVVASQEDITELEACPITYRAGETVKAMAQNGENITLVSSPSLDGDVVFSPTKGGVWRLSNSNGEDVFVGVDWSVFSDYMEFDSIASDSFCLDTFGEGPDRKLKIEDVPYISFSGDDWAGDVAAVCDLTVEPPEDQGIEPSVFEGLIGTGLQRVLINKNGKWVVTLNMENKISHTAVITIQGGLMILVR